IPPTAAIAGAFPSPGGLGAAELAITGLVAALSGISIPQAAAIALLYRVCTYWSVLGAGGLCILWLSTSTDAEVPTAVEPPVELNG
ncbi:MAG: lysylphosphatidylglycerol synthase domain-containing protein, partial [Halobacteriaceae archaeon]